MSKSKGKKAERQEVKAGLQFPVGRIKRYLKEDTGRRVGANGAVFLTSSIETLIAEVLEQAGNLTKSNDQAGGARKRIKASDIHRAILADEGLSKSFGNSSVVQGGVLPHIHKVLLPKKSKKQDEGPKKPRKPRKPRKKEKEKGEDSYKENRFNSMVSLFKPLPPGKKKAPPVEPERSPTDPEEKAALRAFAARMSDTPW